MFRAPNLDFDYVFIKKIDQESRAIPLHLAQSIATKFMRYQILNFAKKSKAKIKN